MSSRKRQVSRGKMLSWEVSCGSRRSAKFALERTCHTWVWNAIPPLPHQAAITIQCALRQKQARNLLMQVRRWMSICTNCLLLHALYSFFKHAETCIDNPVQNRSGRSHQAAGQVGLECGIRPTLLWPFTGMKTLKNLSTRMADNMALQKAHEKRGRVCAYRSSTCVRSCTYRLITTVAWCRHFPHVNVILNPTGRS